MEIIHAIILGAVEGLTEFLPISSTAHLTFAQYFLKLEETEMLKSFSIIIQIGAIFAVLFVYWKRFTTDMEANKKVLVAFLPTAIIGFVLYKIIKVYFIGNLSLSIWVLGIGGVALIIFERLYKDRNKDEIKTITIGELSYKKAVLIGVGQSLAVVPGVSRSGATLVSSMLAGLSRKEAVEFSFLLALPTMLAATSYEMLKNYEFFSRDELSFLAFGLISSFIFGIIGIQFLKKIANAKSLEGFGWYRIIFAILFLVYLF